MTTPGVNKLLECAKAIEDGDLNLAESLIKDVLTDTDDKLVKYFVEALVRLVYKIYPKNPRPLVPSCTNLTWNMDYQFFPFFWFSELTTCYSIADTLTGKKRVQVIDFSLMASGRRWGCLLHDYVKQSGDAISFHLTSIGPILSKKGDYLNEILEKLPAEAKKLPIEFEVKHVVANTPSEIVEAALKLERSSQDETIVVRWEFELHKLLAQPGATESVLSKLKELKPEIMFVVEQEASLNGQDFLECFSNAIHYYSIVFDSLDNDNFDDGNHCEVLWEMYFRRQISNSVAQHSTDQILRLQTFAEWREILFHSGFHHVRLQTQIKETFCHHLPEYSIEEKNRHPVLYRHDDLLLFTSAWKPDPTQPNSESLGSWNQEPSLRAEATIPGGSSGPPILMFLDDEPDDPHLIIEENVWSPECFSINQIAASAEIFDMMEYICHVHYLPLALTWMSDRRVLHLEKSACYLNDFTMVEFMEACGEHHLEEGTGVAGKALQLNSMYFVSDISKLDVKDYPFIFDSWEFGLHGVVAIKLASMHISSINYVLEFFLPLEMKEISAQRLLVNEIVSILQKNSRNSWRVCNEELSRANIGSEVEIMAEEVGTTTITPAAIPASQPLELSEIGSLNSSQIRELCNIFKPPGDEVWVPETHDQEVEQQNSIFRPAADHFNTSEVEIMAEEVGTNTITQAAIPGSQPPGFSENVSLTSSQIRELCNICTLPGDEVWVPETHDQELEQQNSIFRPAADHFNTSEVEIMAEEVGTNTITQAAIPASQPPELSESGSLNSSQIRYLCNIFSPPGDEVRVPETLDQEVEQQNSTFRPAADQFNTYEVEIMAEEVGTNTITQAAIPASQPPELSGCLSSFSWLNVNPPGDEVRVPETLDQEVEQQNSTFRPAADHSNTGTRRKRQRTSEVWLYFDEVIENGEVWAKCRYCIKKYRGEGKRGTTNLRKHLKLCTGMK